MAPQDELDIYWEWQPWLDGATITSFTVTPPPGITVTGQSQSGTRIKADIRFTSPPAIGTVFDITCQITTNTTPPQRPPRVFSVVAVAKK